MRKVSTRKFAKVEDGQAVILFGCGGLVRKISSKLALYYDYPFPFIAFPANALESGNGVSSRFGILLILGICTFAKIVATIIKGVPVFVISKFSLFKFEDKSVHGYSYDAPSLPAIVGAGVAMSIFSIRGKPLPFNQPFVVGGVNYGDLAL